MEDATHAAAISARLTRVTGSGGEHRERGQTRLVVTLAVVLGVGVVALLSGVLWSVRDAGPTGPVEQAGSSTRAPTVPRGPAPTTATLPAVPAQVEVLRSWDARRARAWATGDVGGLGRLYTPASRAGRADVRMLRAYLRRGLRVTGLRQQVLGVRVLARTPGSLRLRVTDRLSAATAVGPGLRQRLPAAVARRRVVELVRVGGTWRVAEVRAA